MSPIPRANAKINSAARVLPDMPQTCPETLNSVSAFQNLKHEHEPQQCLTMFKTRTRSHLFSQFPSPRTKSGSPISFIIVPPGGPTDSLCLFCAYQS